ncbi:hypothetical protein EMIT0P294_130075 [Pseudomonas sp. IT-P294]
MITQAAGNWGHYRYHDSPWRH